MSRKRQQAFTLVELLVVIGIIAILVGIILPALSKARERGVRIQCQSNLRQIGIAFQYYYQDQKQFLPSHWIWPKTNDPAIDQYRNWDVMITKYIRKETGGNPEFDAKFKCPAKPEDGETATFWSYGYNGNIADGNRDAAGNQTGVPFRYKNATTKKPSDFGLIMDHQQRVFYTGNLKYFDPTSGDGRWRAAYRHGRNDIVNLLYLDGHVGEVTKSEMLINKTTTMDTIHRLFDRK